MVAMLEFTCTNGMKAMVRTSEVLSIHEDPEQGIILTTEQGINFCIAGTMDSVVQMMKQNNLWFKRLLL